MPASARRSLGALAIAGALAVAALAVYAPVGEFSFLNLDDDVYVTAQPLVRDGLSAAGLRWALTSAHGPNWHPVTTLSHMLDCELFGLDAGAHHRINAALHAADAALLFAALLALTGALWPSGFAAALFALHPLRVESVAWVAERKDVLSTLFFLLALIAYARYARRPSAGRYALVALAFALGLLAKPMLVTLPFVLLLLDVWPLGRLESVRGPARVHAAGRLVVEKLPLLAASAAVSAMTIAVQRAGGAFSHESGHPLAVRAGNAVVSTAAYLADTFWPSGLAAFYPYRVPSLAAVVAAAAVLLAVTAAVAIGARRRPYLAVGWLWFLGTLVPVIGLVQVGEQGMADRYTYVPGIGIAIMVAWLGADVARGSARRRVAVAAVGCVALLALALAARRQVEHWRDTETVFRRALAVTEGNHLAHVNLGVELLRQERAAEAEAEFAAALAARPGLAVAHLNLGIARTRRGDLAGAVAALGDAVRADPANPLARRLLAQAHDAAGSALERQGRTAEAIEQYRAVIPLLPDDWRPVANLAAALSDAGRGTEAIALLEGARRRWPGVPELGGALAAARARGAPAPGATP